MARLLLLVAAATLLLASVPSAHAADETVTGSGSSWSPDAIAIEVGDTVTWTWTGIHNLRLADGSFSCDEPGCARTFDEPGEHVFFCAFHGSPQAGMRGTITVAAAQETTDEDDADTSQDDEDTSHEDEDAGETDGDAPQEDADAQESDGDAPHDDTEANGEEDAANDEDGETEDASTTRFPRESLPPREQPITGDPVNRTPAAGVLFALGALLVAARMRRR